MSNAVNYNQLQQLIDESSLDDDASHLHGLCVGLACGSDGLEGKAVGQALTINPDEPRLEACVEGLYQQAQTQLQALGTELQPILPHDEAQLQTRGEAIVSWVRGFISGFGLGGVQLAQLSADGREAMRDLNYIASTQVEVDDATHARAEAEESAHIELIEFIRVVAMMLHAEVRGAAVTRSGQGQH